MKDNSLFIPFLKAVITAFFLLLITLSGYPQKKNSTNRTSNTAHKKSKQIFYGLASFYADKFHGRRTANGEIFSNQKFTAACNILPLNTWIQVTNLKNGKIVVLKTTDRLHTRMRRLIDLSQAAAKKLGYIKRGLTRVKVEVLNQSLYKKSLKQKSQKKKK